MLLVFATLGFASVTILVVELERAGKDPASSCL